MKLRMDALLLVLQHDMALMNMSSEATPGRAMQYSPSYR
jgi:hypothetical protein